MNRKLISQAAAILHEEAESCRDSCRGGTPERDWACDPCSANGACRRRYEKLKGCADKLDRYMRRPKEPTP